MYSAKMALAASIKMFFKHREKFKHTKILSFVVIFNDLLSRKKSLSNRLPWLLVISYDGNEKYEFSTLEWPLDRLRSDMIFREWLKSYFYVTKNKDPHQCVDENESPSTLGLWFRKIDSDARAGRLVKSAIHRKIHQQSFRSNWRLRK